MKKQFLLLILTALSCGNNYGMKRSLQKVLKFNKGLCSVSTRFYAKGIDTKNAQAIFEEGRKLFNDAYFNKMFTPARENYKNYKGLLSVIGDEYSKEKCPLLCAYNDLIDIEKKLVGAINSFSIVKQMILNDEISQSEIRKYGLDVYEINDYIKEFKIYLGGMRSATYSIAKSPVKVDDL